MSDAPESSLSSQYNAFSIDPSADRPEGNFDLSNSQGQPRIVLIFTLSERSPVYQQQMEGWDMEGIHERQLKLVEMCRTELGQVDGQRSSPQSIEQLRQQFGIAAEDFAIILVGKDGMEKQRSPTPVNSATTFQALDAIPMRQQEMRDRQ
jgi:DNA-binding transcriptional regulator YiaG